MTGPAQQRDIAESDQQTDPDASTDDLTRLDERIADQRARYLTAYFKPDGGEAAAREFRVEIDRLLDIRCFLMRGGRLADYLGRG